MALELYQQGPQDRESYFKQAQEELDAAFLAAAHSEAVEPVKEAVFESVLAGRTEIDCSLSGAERQKKVFAFLARETRQIVASQVKQLGSQMDNL